MHAHLKSLPAVKISGAIGASDFDRVSSDDDVEVISSSVCSESTSGGIDSGVSSVSDTDSLGEDHELLDNPVDDPELGAFLMDTFDSLLETTTFEAPPDSVVAL